jgi:hypothetical protein
LRTQWRSPLSKGLASSASRSLTLSPYIAIKPDDREEAARRRERQEDGPTLKFARRLAGKHGVYLHASLYEALEGDERGFNTGCSPVTREHKRAGAAGPGERQGADD